MICKKCGAQYDSGKICPKCGSKQGLDKKQVVVIIGALVVVGLAGGIFATLKLNGDITAAQSAIEAGNYVTAKEKLDDQLTTNGTFQKLYVVYADYYLAQNDYLAAINVLEDGLKRCNEKNEIEEKLASINANYSAEIKSAREAQAEADRMAADEAAHERERQEREKANEEQKSKEDYIASCQPIPYEDLARNPDKHKGQPFTFTGEVIQTIEPTFGNTVVLRINVTKTKFDFYTDTIYATLSLPDGADRILDGDILTIYGDCEGLHSYTNVLGVKISLPKISVQYYSVN